MHRSCRWRTPSAESSLAVATHRPQGRRFRDRCGHASSRAEPYPPEGEGAFRPAGGSCLANRQVHGPPRGRPARRRDRRRLKTCNSWEPGGVSLTFASMRAPHCGHTRERDDVITAPEPALVFAISREARVRWRTPARTRTQSRWGRRRLSAPPRLRPAHNLARPRPGALDGRSAMRLHKPGRVAALSMWTDGRSVRATFGAPVHRRPSTSARSYVHGIDALASGAAEGVGEGRRPAPVQIGDGGRRGPFSGL